MQHKNSLKISNSLDRIEHHITNKDLLNPKVSKVSVGWHIDHMLKVINGVIKTMEASDPTAYKNNFSIAGRFFLGLGIFPRGKARAPKSVMPPENITTDSLMKQLQEAKINIANIPNLHKNTFFKHPLFGNISKPRILRFLETHTKHHMKIVTDILKA